jgi:hypothetical protein
MGLHIFNPERYFILPLRDLKASMNIIEDMTLKYQISFHLIFGTESELSTVPTFKKMLEQLKLSNSLNIKSPFGELKPELCSICGNTHFVNECKEEA